MRGGIRVLTFLRLRTLRGCMKNLLFAGLALALVVPAWSQTQPQNPPPPPRDGGMAPGEDAPDNGDPQPDVPMQPRDPHPRGEGGGPQAGESPFGDGKGPQFGGRSGRRDGGFGNNPFGPPMAPPPQPPVSMFADDRFLFILRGDTLMKFDKTNLTLLQSVELPRPVAPAPDGAPAPASLRARTSPPLLKRAE